MWIFIKISLKYVPKGPNDNIPALVQIIVWGWWQAIIWTNDGYFTDAYIRHLVLNKVTSMDFKDLLLIAVWYSKACIWKNVFENVICVMIAFFCFKVVVNFTVTFLFNSLRPRQNGRHFADDIFKCIFLHENAWISIKISLKFVP